MTSPDRLATAIVPVRFVLWPEAPVRSTAANTAAFWGRADLDRDDDAATRRGRPRGCDALLCPLQCVSRFARLGIRSRARASYSTVAAVDDTGRDDRPRYQIAT